MWISWRLLNSLMECYKMLEVLRRLRTYFTGKTFLEQFLIVFSLILLVSFVPLLISLMSRNGSAEIVREDATICTTETCLKYATNILKKMNPDVDACDDFYEFSCGSYSKFHTLPDRKRAHDVQDDVEDEVYSILRSLLTSKKYFRSRSVKDAKAYYKCCVEGTDEFEGIGDLIQQILKTSDVRWSSLTSDKEWNRAVVKMILYGSYPFYDVSLQAKDDVITINLMRPEPETKKTLLTETAYMYTTGEYWRVQKDYRDLIDSTLLLIEKAINENRKVNDENCTRLHHDMARSYSSWEKNVALGERSCTVPRSHLMLTKKPFCLNLEHQAKWIFALLQEIDPNDGNVYKLSLKCQCPNYVRVIEEKLRINENRYYALWRHIARFLPVVSSSFRHSYMRLYEAMNPVNKDIAAYNEIKYYNEKWKQCVHLTNDAYGLAVAHVYKSEDYQEEDEEIFSFVESVLTTYQKMFSSQTSMNNETIQYYLEKLEDLTVDIYYPDFIVDNVKLDDFYFQDNSKYYKERCNPVKQGQHPKGCFIYGLLRNECIRYKTRLLKMWYDERLNGSSFLNIPPVSPRVSVDLERNFLTLPVGVLRFPYYSPNFFKFAKYGGISSLIIRELSRKLQADILQNGDDDDEFGVMSSPEMNCLMNTIKDSPENSHRIWKDVIFDHITLKVAYELYQMDMEYEADEPNLPNLDYSSDQLFFIHYAQMHCEIRNNTFSIFDNSISAKFRVNSVMMNKKEFAEAFECPEESPMNPSGKCPVWE